MIGTKLGQYLITELLGEGGMALVYKAHQPSLNRDVAIKILTGPLARDEEFVTRFRREAIAAGSLGHPNILTVHDAGVTEDGLHYIVMEYASGGPLSDLLRRGPLPVERACEIGAQIAAALQVAHKHGIVHRDLKPSNILLARDGRPLLMDFGVALVGTRTRLTRAGTAVGTPEYMSPEQAQGLPVGERSDIYSLGILMYEMLTGDVPFASDTPLATLYQHVHDPVPQLSERDSQIPTWLSDVIACALAKQPEERYQTAGEMAVVLRDRPGTVHTSAKLPTTPDHQQTSQLELAAPTRQGRGQQIWLLAILVAVVLVAAGTWVLMFRPATQTAIQSPKQATRTHETAAAQVDRAKTATSVAFAIATAEAKESAATVDMIQDTPAVEGQMATVAARVVATTQAKETEQATAEARPTQTPQVVKPTTTSHFSIVPYESQHDTNVECVICRISDWTGPSQPGHYGWEVDFPLGEAALISMGWCAYDEQTLDENWSHMNYRLIIDGHNVPLDQLASLETLKEDRVCRSYKGVLKGWALGHHSYSWVHHIEQPVFDGWDTYEAGDYVMEFEVEVKMEFVVEVEPLAPTSTPEPSLVAVIYENDFSQQREPLLTNVGEIHWQEDELRILATEPGKTCVAGFMRYVVEDFYLDVRVRPIQMSSDGLYWVSFHVDPEAPDSTGYELRVEGDSTCHVRRRVNEATAEIIVDREACPVAIGSENQIEIMGADEFYAIFFNGELLFQFEDVAFPSGAIGLAAGNGRQTTGTLIAFDDLTITEP